MNTRLGVVATCSLMALSAVSLAAPVQAQPVPVVLDQVSFHGRLYCFYTDGWHGPGWYWCGYAFRRGIGWGGPDGWQGFHRGHGGRVGGHGGGGHGAGGHGNHGGGHGGGGHGGGVHSGHGGHGGGHGGGGHGGHGGHGGGHGSGGHSGHGGHGGGHGGGGHGGHGGGGHGGHGGGGRHR